MLYFCITVQITQVANQIDWATWVIWKAMKKYSLKEKWDVVMIPILDVQAIMS